MLCTSNNGKDVSARSEWCIQHRGQCVVYTNVDIIKHGKPSGYTVSTLGQFAANLPDCTLC